MILGPAGPTVPHSLSGSKEMHHPSPSPNPLLSGSSRTALAAAFHVGVSDPTSASLRNRKWNGMDVGLGG